MMDDAPDFLGQDPILQNEDSMRDTVAPIVDIVKDSDLNHIFVVIVKPAVGVIANVAKIANLKDTEHHEVKALVLEFQSFKE
jgi:hypothetical protein